MLGILTDTWAVNLRFQFFLRIGLHLTLNKRKIRRVIKNKITKFFMQNTLFYVLYFNMFAVYR